MYQPLLIWKNLLVKQHVPSTTKTRNPTRKYIINDTYIIKLQNKNDTQNGNNKTTKLQLIQLEWLFWSIYWSEKCPFGDK